MRTIVGCDFLVTTHRGTAFLTTSGSTGMQEVQNSIDEQIDKAAFQTGLRLEFMLIRLDEGVPRDDRRILLEEHFGFIPSKEMLMRRRVLSDSMRIYQRTRTLAGLSVVQSLAKRASESL